MTRSKRNVQPNVLQEGRDTFLLFIAQKSRPFEKSLKIRPAWRPPPLPDSDSDSTCSQTEVSSKPQTTLNHYVLTARLGRGANGTVHLAIDLETGREIAMKVTGVEISSDSAALQREIRSLRRLNHPKI
jgi:serine/threonine protein kinase